MRESRQGETSFWRSLGRVLGTLALVLLALLVWLSAMGFPSALVPVLTRRLSTRALAFEASAARLDLWRGVILEDVRVFRRGAIGAPAVEAGRVTVNAELTKFSRTRCCLSRVEVRDARVRLRMLQGPRVADSGAPKAARRDSKCGELRLELYNCIVEGIDIDSASCRFRTDGAVSHFEDIVCSLRHGFMVGSFRGSASFDPRTSLLGMHLETKFDPHVLLPVLECYRTPILQTLVRRFEFAGGAPHCVIDLRRDCSQGGDFALDGTFSFRHGAYRGVDLLRADGRVMVNDYDDMTIVTIDPLSVVRPEGTVKGNLTLDTGADTVTFNAMSTLYVPALARMINVLTNSAETVLHYKGPVRLEARGVAGTKDIFKTDFVGTVQAKGLGSGRFTTDECSCSVRMIGPTNTLSNIRGRIYDGTFSGQAVLVAPHGAHSNTQYSVDATVVDVDFEELAGVLTGETDKEYEGTFYGHLALRGLAGEGNGHSARGDGHLGIKNGHVYMLPVFGGLQAYMTKIIPGLDFVLSQSDAKASFTIADRRVHSEDVKIKGDIISLSGKGSYGFDHQLAYDVQMRLLRSHTIGGRILKPIFYPLSKLFEFRLRGTLEDPNWRLINFSRDLLEKLGLRKKTEEDAVGGEEVAE
jgi:hypothetical protein